MNKWFSFEFDYCGQCSTLNGCLLNLHPHYCLDVHVNMWDSPVPYCPFALLNRLKTNQAVLKTCVSMSSVIQVIYISAPVPWILVCAVLLGQIFPPCLFPNSKPAQVGRAGASEDTKWLGPDTCLTWVLWSQINPCKQNSLIQRKCQTWRAPKPQDKDQLSMSMHLTPTHFTTSYCTWINS